MNHRHEPSSETQKWSVRSGKNGGESFKEVPSRFSQPDWPLLGLWEHILVNPNFWHLRSNGWFPLSRSFYVLTCVTFAFAFKIEAMYERSHVNVKVEPRSTSRLHSQHFISCLYFITWLTINVCSRVKLCSQIEVIYERSSVNVKVEPHSTFTFFTHDL